MSISEEVHLNNLPVVPPQNLEIELHPGGSGGNVKDYIETKVSDFSEFYSTHLSPKVRRAWNVFRVVIYFIASFFDPLIFFAFSTMQENNCIIMKYRAAKIITIARLMIDLGHLISTAISEDEKVTFFQIFLALPLPLTTVMGIPAHKGVAAALRALTIVVLIQYLPRLYVFIPLIINQASSLHIFETAWENLFVNFITFLLGAHTVGSLWYSIGFWRINECLQRACLESKMANCEIYRDCRRGDDFDVFILFPDWITWKNYENATACLISDHFPYGIFKQVPDLSKRSFFTRYMYSIYWGLQQISTLAGNLTPTAYGGEIVFTMGIIVIGLLLFAFLIGNVQLTLEALGRRKFDLYAKREDTEKWIKRYNLPRDLKRTIVNERRQDWHATGGVTDELMGSFSRDLQEEIYRLFDCINLVNLPFESRKKLKRKTYHPPHTFYDEDAEITELVFICRGEVLAFSANSPETLGPGTVLGGELLTWYRRKGARRADEDGEEVYARPRIIKIASLVETVAYTLSDDDVREAAIHSG